jgi:hypothetical protein
MLEAVTKDLVFTISLKRSTQNLQLSTSWAGRLPHLLALSGGLRNDRNPSALGSQADILAGENFFQPAGAKVGVPPRSGNLGLRISRTAPLPA